MKSADKTLSFDFNMADSSYPEPKAPAAAPEQTDTRPEPRPAPEPEPESAPAPPPRDRREVMNEQALKTAAFLEAQNMKAAGAFRELLKRFTGQGGIKSSQDSLGQYLTPYEVTRLITDLVYVQSGSKVFDPTCGTGRFFEFLPDGCAAAGIEIDPAAARIAKLLYPQHNIECGDLLNNLHFRECFDFVLGNPPFGLWWKVDPRKSNLASAAGKIVSQWKILEAGITALKRGGILALVVPQNTFTNDRAADQRAARFWNTNCIIRAEINLPKNTFKESGTQWPCSIIVIQRPPAESADIFRYEFSDVTDAREYEDCIAKYRASSAFARMIEGQGALVKDRTARQKEIAINTEHAQAKKEFEYVYSGELQEQADQDIIYVKRAGHQLKLRPNCLIAALKLEQWKQNVTRYHSSKIWQRHCTVDNIVLRDSIKGFKDLGLTIQVDPDLEKYLKGKRSFYRKENLKMAAIPSAREAHYQRNLTMLKTIGIWDRLFPYQRHDAAVHAIKNFSFIGYIQGLGKTRTAIAAVMLKDTKENLFVCYSRLTKVWYDELRVMGAGEDEIKIIHTANDLFDIRKYNIISFETLRKQDRTDEPVECQKCGATVTGKTCMAPNPNQYEDNKTCGWHRFNDAICPKCGNHKGTTAKNFTGRYCHDCGYADQTWKPGIYKRMRKLFSCIVVDESQASKNRNSQQGRALRTLKAKHKMILTGTILENYISECFWQLWWLLGASCRFPYPFQGGHNMFVNRFCQFTTTKTGRRKMLPAVQNVTTFYEMMDSITTRRTEKDKQVKEVINLPDYEETRVQIKPTKEEMALYEQALNNFEEWYREQLESLDEVPYWLRGDSKKALSAAVLVKLNALRRISSCPFMYDSYKGNGTAKMKFIKGVVDAKIAEGKKVLVSSCYKPLVNMMLSELPNVEGFTGEMPIPKRNKIMEKFQTRDDPKVLAVTTQCCNLGVTLTRASTAIIADLLWSPKALEQMWKRIHRVGQTEECEVIYLINQGMIDDDINKLIIDKDAAINKAIDRVDTIIDTEFFSPLDFANKMLAGRGRSWISKYMGKD